MSVDPVTSLLESSPRPVVLVIRDGWGRNPHPEHREINALALAQTPICDGLLEQYPWTLIGTSGEAVGLPAGTMGNSEVGHQNLGAGRVVDQESVRITKAVANGSFYANEAMVRAVDRAKSRDGAVHLLGIASDAGVHGLLTHLYACLELCRRRQLDKVFIHLLTDGRDTGPFTGKSYVEQVAKTCLELGVGHVATLCGRYYAMDRDNRWERVRRAYEALTGRSEAPHFQNVSEAIQDYYDHPETERRQGDEFVTPRTLGAPASSSRIRDGDTVIFYNYRGDRPREIVRAFRMDEFYGQVPASPDSGEPGFDRGPKLDLAFVTLTAYQEALNSMVDVAFPKLPRMVDTAGSYLSSLGLRQFRCAETEKFPHVTFFFNDYREEPWPGESRAMAQSPSVATYDAAPAMSAREVCDQVLKRLQSESPDDFILANFANTDMVGHTGVLNAAIQAAETVDGLVGELVEATLAKGGKLIVTADHGNSEQMWDPVNNAPHTAHTLYPVECILVDPELRNLAGGSTDTPSSALRPDGCLADVFPTLLQMMGIPKPEAMTGKSLGPQL